MKLKVFILFIFCFSISLNLKSQAPRFESYKVIKDVNGVQVNAIVQDTSGFIWLGTDNGLFLYDGINFISFAENGKFPDTKISSLTVDKNNGTIWIGNSDGKIFTFNKGKIEDFEPEEGLSSKEISSLFIDNNNTLWFTTLDEGIYYYMGENRKRLYNISSDDGLLDNYVYSMVQINDSLYYFGTDKGISVYNFNQKMFVDEITTQDGLPDNLVKKIIYEEPYIWIGMLDGGICKYNVTNGLISGVSQWIFGALSNFIKTPENEIWVSTQKKGIVRIKYDNKNIPWYSSYTKSNGLIDNRTQSIIYDREGNIWVGTKKGLSIRKNNYIEFFDTNSDFYLTDIFSITTDDDGQYWLATQNGLFLYHHDKMGEFSSHKILDFPQFENTIYISIYKDANNFIWVGTYGFGLFKINPLTLDYQRFTIKEGLSSNDIFHITGDTTNIWLSTAGGGVSRLSLSNTKNIKVFTMDDGLLSSYVYSIYLENSNKAWLATDGGGVNIIENDQPRPFYNDLLDSLNNKIYSIAPDLSGNLWFNVADKGLIMIDKNNKAFHFNEFNGLSSNSIQSFICNANNEIVLTEDKGFNILNPSTHETDKYGEESALNELKPNLNSIFKDRDDNIYIGTSKGIIKFNYHHSDTLIKPKIIITDKRLFLNTIPKDKTIFKYNENNISFDFTALWYKTSGNMVYRYKLEGYDLEWSAETYTRTVTYPKLPHGNYKFRVEVKLTNGVWFNSNEGEYIFKIKPPIWKTVWFIILSIIAGIVVILSFIRYRTLKLIKDKEILENEVIKRTAEITMQKEEIEAQRDEIEAQRNYVMEQRDRIEIQNKDITASIHYASRIQKAVLPPRENFKEFLGEYFIFFKPRDIVSGDFYYLNKKDDRIIVAAADCTGHGVPGAFMSLLGVALLNQIVSELPENFNAASILDSLREGIKNSLRQTGKKDEAKDGMDISLCVINKNKSSLEYAGAFNPLLIIRDKEILIYKASKMPIGVYVTDEALFTNNSIELQKNDMLYLYSDGFQDQFGGPARRKFLPKNLRNLMQEISHLNLDQQKALVDKAFYEWKGEEHQIDDILVIGIKV